MALSTPRYVVGVLDGVAVVAVVAILVEKLTGLDRLWRRGELRPRDEPISALAAFGSQAASVMVPGFFALSLGTVGFARALRAEAYSAAGQTGDAIADYTFLIELDPGDDGLLFARAGAYATFDTRRRKAVDRDFRVGPIFTLKSAMDSGHAMRVGAADYDDPMRWWL